MEDTRGVIKEVSVCVLSTGTDAVNWSVSA